eukprot:5836919-Pleurochrysis_carterae.AAC.3
MSVGSFPWLLGRALVALRGVVLYKIYPDRPRSPLPWLLAKSPSQAKLASPYDATAAPQARISLGRAGS